MKPLYPRKPPTSDQIRGKRAQSQGALFESLFMRSCRQTLMAITRIPDGCKSIGPRRIMRVRTDFDWIITYRGRTAMIDTKTTSGTRFSPSHVKSPHQVAALSQHADAGAAAGFVIWFREADAVCFMSVSRITEMQASGKGISYKDLPLLGSIQSFDASLIFD